MMTIIKIQEESRLINYPQNAKDNIMVPKIRLLESVEIEIRNSHSGGRVRIISQRIDK